MTEPGKNAVKKRNKRKQEIIDIVIKSLRGFIRSVTPTLFPSQEMGANLYQSQTTLMPSRSFHSLNIQPITTFLRLDTAPLPPLGFLTVLLHHASGGESPFLQH